MPGQTLLRSRQLEPGRASTPRRGLLLSRALCRWRPRPAPSRRGSEPPYFIPADPCTAVEGVHMRTCYALEWLLLPAHRCLHFLLTAHSRMRAGRLVGVSSTQCVRWRDHHARAPASAARGGAGADLRGGGQNRGRRSEAASAAVTGDTTGGRRCGAVARAGARVEVRSERTGAPETAARRC